MIHAPRPVEPTEKINDYTVVVDEGAEDGIIEGEVLMVTSDSEGPLRGRVVDTSDTKSVLEITTK